MLCQSFRLYNSIDNRNTTEWIWLFIVKLYEKIRPQIALGPIHQIVFDRFHWHVYFPIVAIKSLILDDVPHLLHLKVNTRDNIDHQARFVIKGVPVAL